MTEDPIVEDVRKARREHAEKHNNDLNAICEDFRQKEAKLADRLVSREPKRVLKKTGS